MGRAEYLNLLIFSFDVILTVITNDILVHLVCLVKQWKIIYMPTKCTFASQSSWMKSRKCVHNFFYSNMKAWLTKSKARGKIGWEVFKEFGSASELVPKGPDLHTLILAPHWNITNQLYGLKAWYGIKQISSP